MKLFIYMFLAFLPFAGWGQDEVETVRLEKRQSQLFRGQEQYMRNCYIYIDKEGIFYLVTLSIPPAEVREWFEKRRDSQNIYKGILNNGQYKTLEMVKENEPGISISFYYERKEKTAFQLVSMDDGKAYNFQLIP